jgi:Protein of unknown function (DUF4089)
MKRKVPRKTKSAKAKPAAAQTKPPKIIAPQAEQDEAALVAAGARALGLKLDPSWEAGVTFNLHLILRHAALVEEFALPDDAEPAPIFHA